MHSLPQAQHKSHFIIATTVFQAIELTSTIWLNFKCVSRGWKRHQQGKSALSYYL